MPLVAGYDISMSGGKRVIFFGPLPKGEVIRGENYCVQNLFDTALFEGFLMTCLLVCASVCTSSQTPDCLSSRETTAVPWESVEVDPVSLNGILPNFI